MFDRPGEIRGSGGNASRGHGQRQQPARYLGQHDCADKTSRQTYRGTEPLDSLPSQLNVFKYI